VCDDAERMRGKSFSIYPVNGTSFRATCKKIRRKKNNKKKLT
jgi:hypothetical protein